jgi:hypothetical protein
MASRRPGRPRLDRPNEELEGIFLHLGLQDKPAELAKKVLALRQREADLFRRQPNDPSPYFANLNCLYLAPAASGFQL